MCRWRLFGRWPGQDKKGSGFGFVRWWLSALVWWFPPPFTQVISFGGGVPVHASAYGAGGNASGSASGSASSSRKNLPLNSGVDVNVGIGVSDAPQATVRQKPKISADFGPIWGRF